MLCFAKKKGQFFNKFDKLLPADKALVLAKKIAMAIYVKEIRNQVSTGFSASVLLDSQLTQQNTAMLPEMFRLQRYTTYPSKQ